jgi:hypothetical protein
MITNHRSWRDGNDSYLHLRGGNDSYSHWTVESGVHLYKCIVEVTLNRLIHLVSFLQGWEDAKTGSSEMRAGRGGGGVLLQNLQTGRKKRKIFVLMVVDKA